METVLIPLDGSEVAKSALRPGRSAAERAGARIHLLSVSQAGGEDEARSYLEGIAASLPNSSLEVSSGEPAHEILRSAQGLRSPLICMATRGRGSLGRLLLGSTAEQVLAEATCPLLLVGPHGGGDRTGGMVVCVDGTASSQVVLDAAADLARSLRLEVELVEVVTPEESVRVDDVVPVDRPTELARLRLLGLAELLNHQGVGSIGVEVLYGADVPTVLSTHCRRSNTAYLAMASHARRGISQLAHGSTSVSTVHQAPCPVLLVRIED